MSAVLQGSGGRRFGVLFVALLAGAALASMVVAGGAGATGLVGKNGKVYACYRTKGKAKGAVRLVPQHKHCRKGEKKVSWSATGKHGTAGQEGESAPRGENGEAGGPGAAGLQGQVTALTNKVDSLETILKGITNTDLTGLLSKLQGVSGAQLQEAVTSIANVKALCAQATTLTSQANALGTTIGGIGLGGTIPVLLKLVVPPVPAALAPFGC